MAIAIKNIPPLKGKEAKRFVDAAETAERNRATVDFSKQVLIARSILEKSKQYNK